MVFEGFPFIIGWELTLACNLRCIHCGSRAGLPRKNELTHEEAIQICDQFPDLLVQEVEFTGGEPLLRSDWEKIIARLGKHGIAANILSNGLLLNSEMVTRIQKAGITGVGISLDGLEETHDLLRCHKGSFQAIMQAIERLTRKNIPVTILTTVNNTNIHQLPEMFSLLTSLNVFCWQMQPIFHLGRALESRDILLSDDAYLKFGRFVQEYNQKANSAGIKLAPADSFGYFTEYDVREPQWQGCNAGLVTCGITSDGRIKGCLSMPDNLVEGDLRKRDLWDIWFDNASFSYTRLYNPGQLGSNCRACDRADQCMGGCSSMSYGGTGAFHNDAFCFYGIRNREKNNSGDDGPL